MSGSEKPRILVIRGGALGDFVLTLPALALLREAFPGAHLEVLGYPHIACLVDKRFYADAVRSVNERPVAAFYAKNGELSEVWRDYFGSFQQVISYLFDPDQIFEENLRRCGVKHYLPAFRKVSDRHAAQEWAAPLEQLALFLENPAARLYPSPLDQEAAQAWIGEERRTRWVLHPGSGGRSKNWPVAGWASVGKRFFERFPDGELIVVSGEADGLEVQALLSELRGQRVRVAHQLALPLLAGVLAEIGCYLGHDTGVSHVAAAVGARCVLLFGPTDPGLWAPRNEGVQVLRAPAGDWSRIRPGQVWEAAVGLL
jgi:heptosyltransferase-3